MDLLEKNLLENWKYLIPPINPMLFKKSKYYPYFLIINGNLEELKKYHGNLDVKFKDGENAYILACCFGHINIMEYLETRKNFNIYLKNNYGDNAYLLASLYGQKDIMEYLEKKKGFDIHVKNYFQENAYLRACYGGKLNILKYLETKKIDITCSNINQENAYLIASICGHKDIMEYLESKKFNIEATDIHGNNAYLLASYNGHESIMKYLDSKNNNNNNTVKNNDGTNAYLLACFNGHNEILEYLRTKNNFNINIKNNNNNDALFFAKINHQYKTVNYITQKKYYHFYDTNNVAEFKNLPILKKENILYKKLEFYLIYHYFDDLDNLLLNFENYNKLILELDNLCDFLDLSSLKYLFDKKIKNEKIIKTHNLVYILYYNKKIPYKKMFDECPICLSKNRGDYLQSKHYCYHVECLLQVKNKVIDLKLDLISKEYIWKSENLFTH